MAGTLSTTSGISDQFQTHFSKKLLDYAVQSLKLDQFASKAGLPKNTGSKAIRFFRYGEPATTDVQSLTEGGPTGAPPFMEVANYRALSLSTVDVTLAQYGEVIGVSDILSATALLGTLKQASKTGGEDAALKCDTLIRDELVENGSTERFSRQSDGTANSSFSDLGTNSGVMKAIDLLDAVTNLKVNRAPQIDGSYVAVMAPQASRDLMNDTDWLEAHKYSDVKDLYKGEAGSIHGVRVVEATNPYREAVGTEDTHSSSGTIFSTIVTGDNAYGVPALEGDSPMSPKIMVTDTPDKSDPLNQMTTIGWKLFYAAKILNGNFVLNLRSTSNYA